MLVSDPVPRDAALPKSFGVGDDSSLLAAEPSSVLHSVSSTTGPSEVVLVDEDTRMSAETNSRAQTPAKQVNFQFKQFIGMLMTQFFCYT